MYCPRRMRRCIEDRRAARRRGRSEEHTSELQSQSNLVCRPLLETKHRRCPRGTPLDEHCFRVEAAGRPTLSHEHDAFCLWHPGRETTGELTESAAELLGLAQAT